MFLDQHIPLFGFVITFLSAKTTTKLRLKIADVPVGKYLSVFSKIEKYINICLLQSWQRRKPNYPLSPPTIFQLSVHECNKISCYLTKHVSSTTISLVETDFIDRAQYSERCGDVFNSLTARFPPGNE